MADLKEKSISLLASKLTDMKTAATTTLYAIPSGKSCIVTKLVIRSATASLAGFASACFGSNSTAFDNWQIVTTEIAAMTSATAVDAITLSPMTYTVGTSSGLPAKFSIATTGLNFSIKITTGSTAAANATIDVFGYLF